MAASSGSNPASTFGLPLACEPGQTCWISNYVDHDPGKGTRDYQCGTATYNVKSKHGQRHIGTDFAIRDLAVMQQGVDVLAAAPGVVAGVRDGMRDVNVRSIDSKSLKGQLCGNGVAIRHASGLTSQYCHLRQGSITVKKNEPVKRGQKLGLVGLSGATQYPHLHITVRHGKKVIDPFVGLTREQTCGLGNQPLWNGATLAKLPYGPSALYIAGFADEKPKYKNARAGVYRSTTLSRTAPALVLWVDMFQTRAGDRLTMVIVGPDGKTFHKSKRTLKKNRARSFSFAGKKRKAKDWPTGTYTGVIQLNRTSGDPGKKIYTIKRTITVR